MVPKVDKRPIITQQEMCRKCYKKLKRVVNLT